MRCSSPASRATNSAVCRGPRGWGRTPIRGARCGCRPARRCGSTRSCSASRAAFRMSCCAIARGWGLSRTPARVSPPNWSISKPARASASSRTTSSAATARPARSVSRSASIWSGRARSATRCICSSRRRTCWSAAERNSARSSCTSTATGWWANVRVIDPVNGMWRLMVLDSDGKQTPQTIDPRGAAAPRGRQGHRRRMDGRQRLDAAQPGRRALFEGPGVPRRRRRASAFADRRARHEHRAWRRGRPRLEACGRA